MEKIIVQFIIIASIWVGNAKVKHSWLTSSSWLLGIYMLGAFMGIIDMLIVDYKTPKDFSFWLPLFMFDLTLLLYLLPFRTFKENRISQIVLPNKKFLDLFSSIIILLSFYSIVFYSSAVILIFSLGDLGALRESRYGGEEFVQAGVFNTIASVSASLYVVALLLFFIYAIMGKSKIRCALLLLSSFSEVFHILSFVGRDGIVFWLFSFVFLFLLFRPFLPHTIIESLKKYLVIGAVALLVPFYMITSSRFEDTDSGVSGSIVSYLGQQFVCGPIYFSIENPPESHWGSFPLVREVFNLPEPKRGDGVIVIGEWRSDGFSTFLSSFRANFGLLGMYIVAFLSLLFFHATVGRCKRVFRLENILIYILYFQVLGQGVFYFKQYSRGGNLFIVLCVVLYVFFRLMPLKNRIVLIKNNVNPSK